MLPIVDVPRTRCETKQGHAIVYLTSLHTCTCKTSLLRVFVEHLQTALHTWKIPPIILSWLDSMSYTRPKVKGQGHYFKFHNFFAHKSSCSYPHFNNLSLQLSSYFIPYHCIGNPHFHTLPLLRLFSFSQRTFAQFVLIFTTFLCRILLQQFKDFHFNSYKLLNQTGLNYEYYSFLHYFYGNR